MKKTKPVLLSFIIILCSAIVSSCLSSATNDSSNDIADTNTYDIIDYSNENINAYTYENAPQDTFSPITFMTVSDIHYLSPTLHDEGEAYASIMQNTNGQMQNVGVEIFQAFIKKVKEIKPDYLLVTGDLTFNGERASHEELAMLFEDIESTGTHVLVVPGNHDINNVYAREFFGDTQQVTPYVTFREFSNIYVDFGKDIAILQDSSSFSYVVEHDNVWLLMIDSNKYADNISLGYPETGGAIKEDQGQWINDVLELAAESDKEVIIGMHHNMVPHADISPLFMSDFLVAGATLGMSEFLAEQDVNMVFSGHIHCHDIAGVRYDENFIYDVTTGSLVVYPHNYRVCSINSDGEISITTGRITDLDGKVFDGDAFGVYSRDLAYDYKTKSFATVEGVSSQDATTMAKYATDVANAYFEGEDYAFLQNMENEEGYNLWLNYSSNTPAKSFIISMSKDTEPRDNHVIIDLNTGYWSTASHSSFD